MIAALSIIPTSGGDCGATAEELQRVVKASGLPFRVTPTGTCIEGTWAEIFAIAKTCHDTARLSSSRVVTLLGIEDDAATGDISPAPALAPSNA
jgi:uncharacterized protein YqgV (UPF0045/DUF77 family)